MHDREKWERFKSYNLRDVETEMEISMKLSKFPVPLYSFEMERYEEQVRMVLDGILAL